MKSVTVALGAIYASQEIFLGVLKIIMKALMSFFDQTPLGRILNVLGKDVDTVDNVIPMILQSWIDCFFRVKSNKKQTKKVEKQTKRKNSGINIEDFFFNLRFSGKNYCGLFFYCPKNVKMGFFNFVFSRMLQ